MNTPEHVSAEHSAATGEPAPETPAPADAVADQPVADHADAEDAASVPSSATDVAHWLLGRILDADPRPFPQANAVRIARELFGEQWGVLNAQNVPSLHPDVLEAFASMKDENVRWNTRSKAWWVADEERMRGFRAADAKRAAKLVAKNVREARGE